MQLSDLLDRIRIALLQVQAGTHEMTPEGWAAVTESLRKAALRAEGLEQAVRMLEANQMPSINADALVVGLSTGKVSILRVHRSLISHGFDDRPDRRFGEDELGGIA